MYILIKATDGIFEKLSNMVYSDLSDCNENFTNNFKEMARRTSIEYFWILCNHWVAYTHKKRMLM